MSAVRLAIDLRRRARVGLPMLRPANALRNTAAWVGDRRARGAYRELSVDELLEIRRGDTVFVLGSGKSILEIPDEHWRRMEEHQTISFSQFARQSFVRADFHVHGEIYAPDEYAGWFRDNPRYGDTVHVLQEGWPAHDSNDLVARRLLPQGARVFRYRRTSRASYAPPSRRFGDGLVHGWNSSISVTNFALLAGWRRIVLVGVDLYDREYFWTARGVRREDEESFLRVDDRFLHAERVASVLGRWRALLEPEGVELLVHNPRSILADVLEVFRWGRE